MILKNVCFYNEVFEKEVADLELENGRIKAIGIIDGEGRDMSGMTALPGCRRRLFRRQNGKSGSGQFLPFKARRYLILRHQHDVGARNTDEDRENRSGI